MSRLLALAALAVLAVVAAAATGCGVGDPYEEGGGAGGGAAPPADAEVAKQPARDPAAGQPPAEVVLATPRGTLRYAATLAGNWEGAGAVRAFRRLAGLSTGAARAEFTKLAAHSELGVEAALGYSRSQASVEAVVVKGQGEFREGIVVSKQRIASAQLAHLPPEYKVTLVTLTRWGRGWAISSWEPQP